MGQLQDCTKKTMVLVPRETVCNSGLTFLDLHIFIIFHFFLVTVWLRLGNTTAG